MTFRDSLASAFSTPLLMFFAIILAGLLLLYVLAPAARRRLATAALLTLASAGSLMLAALMRGAGVMPQAIFYRIVQGFGHLLLAVAVINISAAAVFDVALAAVRLAPAALMQDLILAVAYVGAALTVLSHQGADLTGILATSAMVTAVVAFSLQDTLGNVIGGMVLHLESSFAPGDRIQAGDYDGIVREIRWRQTTLDTGSGDIIVIPNSTLMKEKVTVLSRAEPGSALRRLEKVLFNVYYDRPPNEVIAAVETALREDPPPGVACEPQPWCVLLDFAESHAVYAVRYWLTEVWGERTASEVRVRIYYALARAGVRISIPNRSIIVTQKDSDVQERSRRLESERRLAALRGIDIFQSLKDEELQTLAGRLRATPFARGEAVTIQGAQADWLFIVYEGTADVQLHAASRDAYQSVAKLKAGDFVGEMGLMTGEPRTATVRAVTDLGCYRLDRQDFKDILARRPEIMEAISLILARRQLELKAARAGLHDEAGRQRLQTAQGDLLSRIRSIFGLG